MKKTYTSRSLILLMEIIISFTFFALSSAICIQLFVKAYTISQTSQALDYAVTQVSSIADLLSENSNVSEALSPYYETLVQEKENYMIYFDEEHNLCDKEDYYYRVLIREDQKQEGLFTIVFTREDSVSPLYEVTVSTNPLTM
ncbi:hypothetical protein M2454_001031 [Aequitasia blattaphilus]|uniref:Uncharacterized protein n=1 Tax=Aequitasia blattaphilus TaxID=2949332 RepID=A0ABT1E957_9FIRM|nr:hypothetical protein [Aequitasia blattaphilus]MCP1102361.1 hypothetical protein [Aequitasia blattaphilus]MCR8615001.1 hypothetical protein [Aequitasia blattaphilus]